MYSTELLSSNNNDFHHARSVYDKAIAEMTHETYSRVSDCWLTELSSIFGERYLAELGVFNPYHVTLEEMKHANRMFNAVHIVKGMRDAFYDTLDHASDPRSRVDEETLREIHADLQGLISFF